ncbi:MAG: hypothetical protein GF350_12045 [Chitinivibrionales bacterium]|nr:hypothetical protein [Chitinivibrionales bacterium]
MKKPMLCMLLCWCILSFYSNGICRENDTAPVSDSSSTGRAGIEKLPVHDSLSGTESGPADSSGHTDAVKNRSGAKDSVARDSVRTDTAAEKESSRTDTAGAGEQSAENQSSAAKDTGLLAEPDPVEFDTVDRMLSISVKVNNIDPEEKFKMRVGDKISENHTAYFTLIAHTVLAEFRYSPFNSTQRIRMNFIDDSLVLDTTGFDHLTLSQWKFDPVGGEIQLEIYLPDVGWRCVLRGKKLFQTERPVAKLNGDKVSSRLDTSNLPLKTRRKESNTIILLPTANRAQAHITLDFPDPLGPPEITSIENAHGKVFLEEESKTAYLDITPRRSRVQVVFTTGVKYGTLTAINTGTNRIAASTSTTGSDTLMLKARSLFDVRFSKTGFPPQRIALETKLADTTVKVSWQPIGRKKIMLRSMVFPGWGQLYSERDVRWYVWPVAQGAVLATTGIFAIITNAAYDNYTEYDNKYLNELDQATREKYDIKRSRSARTYRFARPATLVTLLLSAAVYGSNIADAIIFSIGPESQVAVNSTANSLALTIDF